jgi:aspartate/methionine/tyrosine aminotransferase
MITSDTFPSIRSIPYMGVINVVAEAAKLGFSNGHPDWSNMGQGQPEVGPLAGAPTRLCDIHLEPFDAAYGPVNGIDALREAVAEMYNRQFRKGHASKYTAENVAIASGGRLMLSRAFAIIDAVPLGYQTPDYTAYEEMLDYHRYRFLPVRLEAVETDAFLLSPARLDREIRAHGLGALVLSNPCNPTGQVIAGEDLASYVASCRRHACLFIADEFYSHYIYEPDGSPATAPVSAAAFVDDVDRDPVLIIDGLTKNHRYPGLRVSWAVGPKAVIDALGRAASAIDGGPGLAAQRFALAALDPRRVALETQVVREAFSEKRRIMQAALSAIGVRFGNAGRSTFYLWGDVSGLPRGLNDGDSLFREALQKRVMLVPGAYFDVNPAKGRRQASLLSRWVRFSFGPPKDNMLSGLERLTALVEARRADGVRA